jgi:NAD(P)H dehydrogenase (quinone)
MQHLLVVAHPDEHSFTMGLAHAYADELNRLGHSRLTCDLYRMEFNPVLSAHEMRSAPTGVAVRPDVAQAQDDIRAADVLTVFYPLWWLSMPAILKGFIDRVFARGFAYEAENGNVRGLLTGKHAVLVTCSGAPLPALVERGRWNAVHVLQDTHIFRSAGFEVLEHVHFDEIGPSLPPAKAARHMDRIRQCARQHFPQV